jgi:hypothetical protein
MNINTALHVKKLVDQYVVKHDLIKRLHKRYKIAVIEKSYPVRIVDMKKTE